MSGIVCLDRTLQEICSATLLRFVLYMMEICPSFNNITTSIPYATEYRNVDIRIIQQHNPVGSMWKLPTKEARGLLQDPRHANLPCEVARSYM